jgi:thioredoxin-related protein
MKIKKEILWVLFMASFSFLVCKGEEKKEKEEVKTSTTGSISGEKVELNYAGAIVTQDMVYVFLSNTSELCNLLKSHEALPNLTVLEFSFKQPKTSTFPISITELSSAKFIKTDDNCGVKPENEKKASSGEVKIEKFSEKEIQGSIKFVFEKDEISGTFVSPVCSNEIGTARCRK